MFRFLSNIHLNVAVSRYSAIRKNSWSSYIDIAPSVLQSLTNGDPIVALESTIITHGMPYPINLKTALDVENIVREQNVLPATIGVINGRIKVGLNPDDLEYLANPKNFQNKNELVKISRRDFGYVLSKNLSGGTTVAGTMIVSNLVGIKIFATGGIGGVHRNGHITFDISADLLELGKTPVVVVSSGVKSILDIPRTLEFLETQGVTVAVYGNDNHFPAFYTRTSGHRVPYNYVNTIDIAKTINANESLGLKNGMLVAVPIPYDFAMNENIIQNAIESALKSAEREGISGKEITPYLLENISKITLGKSLQSNVALIKNNAKVASKIANDLANLRDISISHDTNEYVDGTTPVVIGGSILDTCITVTDDDLKADITATLRTTYKLSIEDEQDFRSHCLKFLIELCKQLLKKFDFSTYLKNNVSYGFIALCLK